MTVETTKAKRAYELSTAQRFAMLDPDARQQVLASLHQASREQTRVINAARKEKGLPPLPEMKFEDYIHSLMHAWHFWGRPKQLAPEGNWATWIVRAGRGFGKTRAGAGWAHERAMEVPKRWIALVARTPADAREYMIEGPSGFLRNTSIDERPQYEPSKRRLTWPNGSWATIYSDEEPDQLRGFSGDTAWIDELAKFKNARTAWDNLQFGMREASKVIDQRTEEFVRTERPRRMITTTPRPLPLLREIEARESTVVTHGTSYENKDNLDPSWFEETIAQYEGTRLGRQEIEAEILDDLPGALWTHDMIEDTRIPLDKETGRPKAGFDLPDFQRIVVAIDPSGTKGKDDHDEDTGDDVGIICAAKGVDGMGYVLEDATCQLGPDGWARRAIDVFRRHDADLLVAERNFGGAMVEYTLRSQWVNVPYKEVTASRGKIVRAEPISALYAQGRVSHVGLFPKLEDQMCLMDATGFVGEGSPDRVDALVWALTELMLKKKPRVTTQSGFVKGLT